MQIMSDRLQAKDLNSNGNAFPDSFKFSVILIILGPVDTSFLRLEKLRYL